MPDSIAALELALDALHLTTALFEELGVGTADQARNVRLRAGYYLDTIGQLNTFLHNPIFGPHDARVRTALERPSLLGSFCVAMDPFIVAAQDLDLQAPPAPYGDYDSYFTTNLLNANYNVNQAQFYGRYPGTARAVASMLANYQQNLQSACTRILLDWADIEAVFFQPNQLLRLARIQSTGSDFHKGGAQVLILTFQSNDVAAPPLKLIYKPSDVEADCLLIGRSGALAGVYPGVVWTSLTEIINQQLAALVPALRPFPPLPTYRILPRNYGSSLARVGGVLPLRTSYGYIEFISHDGGEDVLGDMAAGARDYKIYEDQNEGAICRTFYVQAGALLGLACTFSLVDLHSENVIASRYLPRLIDLEISLTLDLSGGDAVTATELFNTQPVVDNRGGFTGEVSEGEPRFLVRGALGHLRVRNEAVLDGLPPRPPHYTKNRLFTAGPAAPIALQRYAVSILTGMREMLFLLGRGAGAHTYDAWFARLNQGVVVRFLAQGTGVLQGVIERTYISNPQIATACTTNATALYMEEARVYNGKPLPRPDPTFVALNPIYTLADFQTLDVPVYYRRIDETDIMDSRGITVAVPMDVWVPQPPPNPDIHVDIGRNHMFANPPTANRVRVQLDALAIEAQRIPRTTTLATSIRQILGLDVAAPIVVVAHDDAAR